MNQNEGNNFLYTGINMQILILLLKDRLPYAYMYRLTVIPNSSNR